MKTLGYYNGKFGPLEEMTVPMNDRACYFGDGVYEATLARNGKIFALKEHLDRFFNSAGLLRIEIPYTREELTAILYDMLAKMDDSDIFIYWQMTRGTGIRQHQFPEKGTKPNLWIFMKPGKPADSSKRLKLTDVEDTRFLHCNIKTLNLLVNVMAAEKAESMGCGECVFHRGDIVTETAHSNISMLKDGKLITHPRDNLILAGVARKHLIEACHHFGIPVEERNYTLAELEAADEVILTAAGSLCISASELDGKPVGGKAPDTLRMLRDYLLADYVEKTGGGVY